jgi:hypothetical protein
VLDNAGEQGPCRRQRHGRVQYQIVSLPSPECLTALRVYVGVIAVANLAWETLHLPLFTIWQAGRFREQVFAVVHCAGLDILIALASLALALVLAGERSRLTVAILAIVFGVTYTGFSEWYHVYVRRSWAYSEWMPVMRVAGYQLGLSPILQWIIVPAFALWAGNRYSGLRH